MSLDLTLKNAEFNFNVTADEQNRVYEFENFRLDSITKLLYRCGEQVVLTPKAVEALIALLESEGKVVSKEALMQRIWADTIVEESNLAQYLHVLRKTLGKTSDGKPYIETLKRRGYRFNGTVRVLENGDGTSGEVVDAVGNVLPKASGSLSRGVERRGNLRAVGNVATKRETAHHRQVERSDNIYSVSEWRRESAPGTPPAVIQPVRSKWFLPLVVFAMIAGSAGLVFGIYKFSTKTPTANTQSVPFRGSEITRLTTTGTSKRAAISPDGLYVAHITAGADGDSVWIRQVAIANDTRIAGPSKSALVWVTFAPDGNFVYYLSIDMDKGETELFRVPVLGGPIVEMLKKHRPTVILT